MVLLMFFEALYFGHFLSFYTMQLEPPKYIYIDTYIDVHTCICIYKLVNLVRPLDPEAVFPKESESGEVFGLVSYARGLAHGAALEPHVAYALH